jgi:hypothetical protein
MRTAGDSIVAGGSLRSMVNGWNQTGVVTSAGKPWTSRTLRRVLLREGNRPIFGEDTADALAGLLGDPSRLTHKGTSRRLVGSFLYRCECGELLRSGGQGVRGRPRYRCTACGLCRVAQPIDELIFEVVCEVLRRDGVRLLPDRPDLRPLRSRAKVLRGKLDRLASDWAQDKLSDSQVARASETARDELAATEKEITRLSEHSALAGIADHSDPCGAFRAADLDRQRAVIDSLVDVTVQRVGPGRRGGGQYFDSETITVAPK